MPGRTGTQEYEYVNLTGAEVRLSGYGSWRGRVFPAEGRAWQGPIVQIGSFPIASQTFGGNRCVALPPRKEGVIYILPREDVLADAELRRSDVVCPYGRAADGNWIGLTRIRIEDREVETLRVLVALYDARDRVSADPTLAVKSALDAAPSHHKLWTFLGLAKNQGEVDAGNCIADWYVGEAAVQALTECIERFTASLDEEV